MRLVLRDNLPFATIVIGYRGKSVKIHIDYLKVGECSLGDFEIEISGMDYGFEINGILGMDFLIGTGAIIDLRKMNIDFAGL